MIRILAYNLEEVRTTCEALAISHIARATAPQMLRSTYRGVVFVTERAALRQDWNECKEALEIIKQRGVQVFNLSTSNL